MMNNLITIVRYHAIISLDFGQENIAHSSTAAQHLRSDLSPHPHQYRKKFLKLDRTLDNFSTPVSIKQHTFSILMGTVDGLNTTWNSFIHQNITHNNVNIAVTPNSINKDRGQLLVPVAADRQTTHTNACTHTSNPSNIHTMSSLIVTHGNTRFFVKQEPFFQAHG